jgi:hypothetical protein
MKQIIIGTGLLAAFFATASFAQVHDRKVDQQDRIANGVQSGQLTAGETRSLEHQQANLNQQIYADKQANGGKLTAADKAQINSQQNALSKNIYADKHNANAATYGNNVVGQRRENQQDRIAQGIRSGSLRPGEAANLEGREANINHQVAVDRKANGGTLTPQEKARVNRQQNRTSRAIYKDKTNGRKGF